MSSFNIMYYLSAFIVILLPSFFFRFSLMNLLNFSTFVSHSLCSLHPSPSLMYLLTCTCSLSKPWAKFHGVKSSSARCMELNLVRDGRALSHGCTKHCSAGEAINPLVVECVFLLWTVHHGHKPQTECDTVTLHTSLTYASKPSSMRLN
jgi:hypothetical protein